MVKLEIESKRMYAIQTSINGFTENGEVKFSDMIEQNYESETIYSMAEIIDDILDLNRKDSMLFQPNRDDCNSKGIITRIN